MQPDGRAEAARDGAATETAAGPADSPPHLAPATETLGPSCWRCRRVNAAEADACVACAAPLTASAAPAVAGRKSALRELHPVSRLMIAYALLLGTATAFAITLTIIAALSPASAEDVPPTLGLFQVTLPGVILDVLWTIAIVAAIRFVPPPPKIPPPVGGLRVIGWLVGGPFLAGMIYLNVTFHGLVSSYVDFTWFLGSPEIRPPEIWEVAFAAVSVCLLPGIFEELFFRHLTLGVLRNVSGTAAAVLISSIMFGFAHLHAPLSIPYLVGAGLFLALMRLWSGGLLLPIILHTLHNGAVLWLELNSLAPT